MKRAKLSGEEISRQIRAREPGIRPHLNPKELRGQLRKLGAVNYDLALPESAILPQAT